jgi:hypothetical protein
MLMARNVTLPVLLIVALLTACRSTPLALHADVRYETPAGEKCGELDSAVSVLKVRVEDGAGAELPGASVYAALIGTAEVTYRLTDRTGSATFEIPKGAYAVTAVLTGFTPRVRGLALHGGCSGAVSIAIDPGPIIEVER